MLFWRVLFGHFQGFDSPKWGAFTSQWEEKGPPSCKDGSGKNSSPTIEISNVTGENVRSEKLQKESFPNFSNFSSRILPRILLRIFPEFFEEFSCFVSWETETRKNSPKMPAIFQCKIPRQTPKIFTKFFWGSRQSKKMQKRRKLTLTLEKQGSEDATEAKNKSGNSEGGLS